MRIRFHIWRPGLFRKSRWAIYFLLFHLFIFDTFSCWWEMLYEAHYTLWAKINVPQRNAPDREADDHQMPCGGLGRGAMKLIFNESIVRSDHHIIADSFVGIHAMRASAHQYGWWRCKPYADRASPGNRKVFSARTENHGCHDIHIDQAQHIKVLTITSERVAASGSSGSHTHRTLIFARSEWLQSNQIGGATIKLGTKHTLWRRMANVPHCKLFTPTDHYTNEMPKITNENEWEFSVESSLVWHRSHARYFTSTSVLSKHFVCQFSFV